MATHPTQNNEGEFEYGQMYFLSSEDAVKRKTEYPLNHGIRRNLMKLLEHIIRSQNVFAQSFMMMRKVEEEVNRHAKAEGINAPYVKLLYTKKENDDYKRFNVPMTNDVCAVFILDADQSFLDNEMVVH